MKLATNNLDVIEKRVYLGVLLGVFLEYFDYALYGFAISYIADAFFPKEDPIVAIMLSWTLFGISFLVRPLGAIIFGHFADRFGRKKILVATIIFMSLATIFMGLIPSYSQIGVLSPMALLICRIIQGMSVSTEYSGSSTYLLELTKHNHGLISGISTGASGIGIFAASALFLLLGANWREAFIVAGAFVGILGVYLRLSIAESPAFLKIKQQGDVVAIPFLQLIRDSPKLTLTGVLISAYVGIVIIAIEVYLPSYLNSHFSIAKTKTLEISTYLILMEAIFAILWGKCSDYIGQTKTMFIGGLLMLIGIFPIFSLFQTSSMFAWIIAATALAAFVGAVDGPIAAFLVNSFPTRIRYTGVSVCYNFGAALCGGFSPAILTLLQNKHELPILQIYVTISALIFLLINVITVMDSRESRQTELRNEANNKLLAEQDKFRKIVKQVIHDITSPIASIDNIVNKLGNDVPENDRVTLRNAATRIAGISQRLLSNYNNTNLETENEDLLVSLALLQIINEKREEHYDKNIIFEIDIEDSVKFIFIKHNAGIFKRMVSNLVNNAVDVLKDKVGGKITITLGENKNDVVVIVEDNGRGMPDHIIEKFQKGIAVTEGKEDGHGLGLTQVRDAILAGCGRHNIYASDMGTEIIMWFPKIATPSWITSDINLFTDDIVIILDDDKSIHGAWDKNFESILDKYPTITVKHCSRGLDVINYLNNLTLKQKQNIFLLTDYELLEQGMNGLNVVEQTKIQRAALVTSYATNSSIQDSVREHGIKMLPKELVSFAKIHVQSKVEKSSNQADIVWLEDQKWYVDQIVREHYSHLKVNLYYDPVNFMLDIKQYPLDTRIILDTYYEYEDGKLYAQTGYDLASELHSMGYSKIIIFTGEAPEHEVPDYLHIVRKKDPEAYKYMDKI